MVGSSDVRMVQRNGALETWAIVRRDDRIIRVQVDGMLRMTVCLDNWKTHMTG